MKRATLIFYVLKLLSPGIVISQEWRAFNDSARQYIARKDFDRAIGFFSQAKDILGRDSANSNDYSQVCISVADAYNASGQQKKVLPFYIETLGVIENKHGKKNIAYAVIADRIGQMALSINPVQAEKYFIEGRDIREFLYGNESLSYAYGCNSLGIFYQRTGKLQKAEALFLQAIKIREKLLPPGHVDIARSFNNLAAVYWSMGEYEKAEPLALEARRMRENNPGKMSRDYAITCMNLGNIYREMGQHEKAKQYYNAAREIRDSILPKQSEDYLETLISLANLSAMTGDYGSAESLYLEVKKVRGESNKKNSNYALVCNNLGDLYTNMQRYNEAESLLREAMTIWDEVLDKKHSLHPYNRNSLGQLYFTKGDYAKAELFLLEARQMWESVLGKNHIYHTQNSMNLARTYWNMGQIQKADALYSEASGAQNNLISKAFQFTNETEKGLYLKNIIGTNDEFYSFYFKKLPRNRAAKPFSISLQNRNLILSSLRQMRMVAAQSNDSTLINGLNDWIHLKEKLARLYTQNNTDQVEINMTEEEAGNKEKELSRLSSEFACSQNRPGWDVVQNKLLKGEAAIEFIRFRLYDGKQWTDSIIYAALLIKPGMIEPAFVPLFESRNLNALLDRTRSDQISGVNELYSTPALYNLVWKPIEKDLVGVRTVYFAQTGDLFRISFGALPVDSRFVLSDKYRLMQVNTTGDIRQGPETIIAQGDQIQLFGGIQYDVDTSLMKQASTSFHQVSERSRSLPDDLIRGNSFQYLPGTLNETESIRKQAARSGINVSLLTGVQASEEAFQSLGDSGSPSVIHIATHGFFFDDPKSLADTSDLRYVTSGKVFRLSENPLFRAGLLFAGANNAWKGKYVSGVEDGIVTAFEVSNMFLPKTKMIVLSACQTGLGDIKGSEGVYGLQRAFRMAGVQNLVMSLWKVPDSETSEFMQAFYANMFAKQTISTAFDNARAKMKNKYRHEPFKWAAWILVR